MRLGALGRGLAHRLAQLIPGGPPEREQRVERLAVERKTRRERSEQQRLVADPGGELRALAGPGDRAVGEVVEPEAVSHGR